MLAVTTCGATTAHVYVYAVAEAAEAGDLGEPGAAAALQQGRPAAHIALRSKIAARLDPPPTAPHTRKSPLIPIESPGAEQRACDLRPVN
jgi:hypothetical protein